MKRQLLAILIVSYALTSEPAQAAVSPDGRQRRLTSILRSEFAYDAAAAEAARSKEPSSGAVEAPEEIVVLPPVMVYAHPRNLDLERAVEKASSKARRSAPPWLGAKVHTKKVGAAEVAVATLLHIPIGFGIRW